MGRGREDPLARARVQQEDAGGASEPAARSGQPPLRHHRSPGELDRRGDPLTPAIASAGPRVRPWSLRGETLPARATSVSGSTTPPPPSNTPGSGPVATSCAATTSSRTSERRRYGEGFDLVLLIFGELNVFSPSDGRSILERAHAALSDRGVLLLEVHTLSVVREIGEREPSWYTADPGLFSDGPHLCLRESSWDSEPEDRDRAILHRRRTDGCRDAARCDHPGVFRFGVSVASSRLRVRRGRLPPQPERGPRGHGRPPDGHPSLTLERSCNHPG